MTKPDTSFGDFLRSIGFWDMALLLVASGVGAGVFLFILLCLYREKTS